MKTTLRTVLQPNGSFRIGLFNVLDTMNGGGCIKAWQMKSGLFKMPTSEREAMGIAEYDLPRSRKEFERASSIISAYLA